MPLQPTPCRPFATSRTCANSTGGGRQGAPGRLSNCLRLPSHPRGRLCGGQSVRRLTVRIPVRATVATGQGLVPGSKRSPESLSGSLISRLLTALNDLADSGERGLASLQVLIACVDVGLLGVRRVVVPARLLMMGIGTRRLQPQPDGHPGSRGRAPGLVMARLSSHRGMEPGLGQVSCAGVDQFVPWGRAERAGPGRVERPGGKTASPGPASGGSGSVLTAGATSG
jgi:hypothetical protein